MVPIRPLKLSTSLIAAVALAGAIGAAWWFQRPSQSKPATDGPARVASAPAAGGTAAGPVVVESALVRVRPLSEDVEAVGSLRSRQGTVVRAEVGGRVTQINFRDGQRIRRGQLLVQLDDRLQRAQVQQAQAELSIAETNHRRNSELVSKGFISRRGVDERAQIAVPAPVEPTVVALVHRPRHRELDQREAEAGQAAQHRGPRRPRQPPVRHGRAPPRQRVIADDQAAVVELGAVMFFHVRSSSTNRLGPLASG